MKRILTHPRAGRQAFMVVLIYIIMSGIWNWGSNALLARFVSRLDEGLKIDMLTDWAFTIITGCLLYQILRRLQRKWEQEVEQRNVAENNFRRTERALKTISACNGVLVRAESEAVLLSEICRVVVERGGHRLAWVGFAENNEEKSVRIAAHAGYNDGYLDQFNVFWDKTNPRGRGPTGVAIRTGKVAISHDFQNDPNIVPWRTEVARHGFACSISLPLRDGMTTFGVLTIYASETNAFNALEVELLTELADDLAYGIRAVRTKVEHSRAEAAQQLFRALIERSSDSIHAVDPESGRFLDFNESACRSLGYTREEMLALSVFDVAVGVDRDRFAALQAEMEKTGHATLEVFDRRKDGSTYPVEVSLSLINLDRKYMVAIARNITQRWQTEESLRHSEAFVRTVLDSLTAHIAVLDECGTIVAVNRAWQQFATENFGGTQAALVGVNYLAACRTDDTVQASEMAAKAVAGLAAVMSGQQSSFHLEYPCHAPGSQRWFMMHVWPLSGGGKGAVVAHENITERKLTEQMLEFIAQEGWRRPQEDYLVRLVEYIGQKLGVDYVFIGRCKDGQTVQTTGLYARGKIVPDMEYSTRGAPCCNVIGKTLCHYGDQLQELFPEDGLLGEMGAQSYLGIPLTDSAGQPLGLMALLDTKPMPDAKLATALLQITSVRVAGEIERRAKVDELQWKTALLEAQMEAAPDGILMIDNQGRRITQNERMNELLKIPRHVSEDPDDTVQVAFVASRAKNSRQLVEKVAYLYAHPEEVSRDEIEFVDGTVVDRFSSPVRDKSGRSCGRIWTFRDITNARQLEEQLRQSQKMEAIGQLAGGVAHDFNNMLSAMLMQTELMEMIDSLPAEVREGLKQIRADTNRAADLTRQLLLFSRRQVMQPRNLDLNEAVTNLAKMLQRIIGEDVRLNLDLHPVPVVVRADAGMLDQVLMNFAVNSRDAMPRGGRLRIKTTEKDITREIAGLYPEAEPGRYACLSVGDTGTGIPPEILPRIFEPFFTTKEAGKGTGLGLATVFGIVKQHKGWITVDNRPGLGVTFEIFLPVSHVTTVDSSHAQPKPKPRGGKETILLVEDEAGVRKLTAILLERHGYKVVAASNGVEALQLWQLHRNAVKLLLTDLVMPGGMGGQEVARLLTTEKTDLKVTYFSGYSAETAGRELQMNPGEEFIQKPFAPDLLLATVRRSLDS